MAQLPSGDPSPPPTAGASVSGVWRNRRVSVAVVLAVLAVLFVSWSGCADSRDGTPDPHPRGPHPIIIVDVDTLAAKHLGAYGYPRDTSPNIDAFATEAIRFEWAFSQAPNTPPSQTSILTGLYPSSHGMVQDEDRVPREVTTLAEAFSALGFVTAAFVDGGYMAPAFGLDQGFDTYLSFKNQGLEKIGPEASRWVEDHAGENFLLLIHTYDVHWPYQPPEPYRSTFTAGLEPPTPGFEPDQRLETLRKNKPERLAARDLAFARARYDGGIRYVDAWFGDFIARLRELSLLERATIVLLSDHGEEFQEHGSVGHDRLYATVTHIPLLIRLPGGTGARGVSQVVESIDLMPTLLELAGASSPPELQGQSLLPLLRGESDRAQVAISESPFFGRRRAIAAGNYRLLLTERTDRAELYHFRADPGEQINLAGSRPRQAEALRQGLENWRNLIGRWQIPSGATDRRTGSELDAETRSQLKALGYLE